MTNVKLILSMYVFRITVSQPFIHNMGHNIILKPKVIKLLPLAKNISIF